MQLLATISAVYFISLVLLLYIAYRQKKWYTVAKGICSALFIAGSVCAWLLGQRAQAPGFGLLVAALALCAAGDVLLGHANRTAGRLNKRAFVFGALSFTLAHLVFITLFVRGGGVRWFGFLLPLALVALLWLLEAKKRVLLGRLRWLGYLYTVFVGSMAASAAFYTLRLGAAPLRAGVVLGGAALFLVSDVVLLFLYFGAQKRTWHRAVNLATYYIGVFLIGLGAYWL